MEHITNQNTLLELRNKGVTMRVQLHNATKRINFYIEDDFYDNPLEFELDTIFANMLIEKLKVMNTKIKE